MQNVMPGNPTVAASMHKPLPFVPHAWPLTAQVGGNTALGSVEQNFTPPSADALHISAAAQPLAAGAPAAPTGGAPAVGSAAIPPLFCATMPATGGAVVPPLPAAAAGPPTPEVPTPEVPALPVAPGAPPLEEPPVPAAPATPMTGGVALVLLGEPAAVPAVPAVPAAPTEAPAIAVVGNLTLG